jgi:hypothetical protein
MKKIIIAVALILMSTAYAFANNKEIDPKVVNTFKEKFTGATDETWSERADFYEVSFSFEGKWLFAFYSKSSNLICVIHHLLSSELPADLQRDLKSTYSNYWITELFELTSEGQTGYFVTLQNADTKFTLNSNEQNSWELFRTYKNL